MDLQTKISDLIDTLRSNISKENEEAHYLLDDLGELMDRLVNELDEAKEAKESGKGKAA